MKEERIKYTQPRCDELDAVTYLTKLMGRDQVETIKSSHDLIDQYHERIRSLEQ